MDGRFRGFLLERVVGQIFECEKQVLVKAGESVVVVKFSKSVMQLLYTYQLTLAHI